MGVLDCASGGCETTATVTDAVVVVMAIAAGPLELAAAILTLEGALRAGQWLRLFWRGMLRRWRTIRIAQSQGCVRLGWPASDLVG